MFARNDDNYADEYYAGTERKKFERAPGISQGVQQKAANESVVQDSLNESSI
jgi:hypothetical protein